ncbi:MAG: hypothetical protein S0880_22480 [Actinomycetota bacterium]|nr:hypothetical protein [Actinomycetota bacterium]
MDLVLIIVAILVVAAIAVAATMLWTRSGRSAELRERFGDDYDRRLESTGDRKAVEAELRDVLDRREELSIRPLPAEDRDRYAHRWQEVQASFVDRPGRAVNEADLLVTEVMEQRGYPVDRFDEQYDMVAADHAAVADHYRAAHAIHVRNVASEATTDDLRDALLHYRALFDELLADETTART